VNDGVDHAVGIDATDRNEAGEEHHQNDERLAAPGIVTT
jgi:hypothetical protein